MRYRMEETITSQESDSDSKLMQHKARNHPALLTIAETACELRISRSTAYELIAAGELEVVHIGRSARVPAEAIDDFVRRLREQSAQARVRARR